MTNESKMLTMLETLTEDVGSIKQGQNRIEIRMDGLEQDVSEMKQDISGLKQEFSEMRQDVSVLKEDVFVLKTDNLSFKEIHTGIFKEIDQIHESLVRIENDQGYKINVLFDAFQTAQDTNADTHQRVSVLEKRVDWNAIEFILQGMNSSMYNNFLYKKIPHAQLSGDLHKHDLEIMALKQA
jgi:chromosome segregation ATPase